MAEGAKNEPKDRLSEHFQKLKLTSLLISMSLGLLSLFPRAGVPLIASITETDPHFLVGALAIIATVVFAHAMLVYFGEIEAIDAQSAQAVSFQHEVGGLIDEMRSTVGMAKNSSDVLHNILTGAGPTPWPMPIDPEKTRATLRETLNGELRTKLSSAATSSIFSGLQGSETLTKNDLRLQLADLAASIFKNRAEHLCFAVDESAVEDVKCDFLMSFPFVPPLHYVDEAVVREIVESCMVFATGDFMSSAQEQLGRNIEILTHATNTAEERLRTARSEAERLNSVLADRLGPTTRQIDVALRALRRSSRRTRFSLPVFDFLIPVLTYVIAMSHALGALFGGFIPPATTWVTGLQAHLAPLGPWASLLVGLVVAIGFAIYIWVFGPPIRIGSQRGVR